MPFFLVFSYVTLYLCWVLDNYDAPARGLLGGIIGIQFFNCLVYKDHERPLLDCDKFLGVIIVGFGLANFINVSFLPPLLPAVYATVDAYMKLQI